MSAAPSTTSTRWSPSKQQLIIAGVATSVVAATVAWRVIMARRRKADIAARTIVIGTRASDLALWQAHTVQRLLTGLHASSGLIFDVRGMTVLGDADKIKPLRDFGSKGVFTKELDTALLDGTISLAVHCMKDLPTTLPDGIIDAAVMERDALEDALLLHAKHAGKTLATLPPGSVLGTSALRRSATIAKHYPNLVCKDIRGNVGTRIKKMDAGEYDGIILAKVGLKRLGLEDRIVEVLDEKKFGYAVGQGALCVVCRTDDVRTQALLAQLDHLPTRMTCAAERALLRSLHGGCKVPIAIRTEIKSPAEADGLWTLSINGRVMSLDGRECIEETTRVRLGLELNRGCEQRAIEAGQALAELLQKKGADRLMAAIAPQREI